MRFFVVVTGLAGAGKTTLAEPLARELDLPLISKDAIKESLFAVFDSGGWAWSKTLSRAADSALIRIAEDLDGAVLDNFWRAETAQVLLAPFAGAMIEVSCRCDPETASRRFYSRVRHPGHADEEADEPERRESFFKHTFPLATLGPVVEVDTESPVDASTVAEQVRTAAKRLQAPAP
jgi:hypothetical protein